MGMIAGLGALGMGAYGLASGPPASNVQMPQMFQMPNQGAAASVALSGIGGLNAFNTYNIPGAQQATQGMLNPSQASWYGAGANQAAIFGQNQAMDQYRTGQAVTGLGMNQLAPFAGQVMNTAMDPQSQLYNYLYGQNQQQAMAVNAASGVGTTPYGAGLTNQADQLFNMNWQNQQLGRQIAGLGAAGGALGQAGSLAQVGSGLSAAAPGQLLQSAGLPYAVQQQIGGGQMGALSGLGQFGTAASGMNQQAISDYLAYINAGTGATSAATGVGQLGLNQANMGFNQGLTNQFMLGGGIGAIGARGYGVPGFGQSSSWGNFNTPAGPGAGYGGGPYAGTGGL
jgi:hypothetical protein